MKTILLTINYQVAQKEKFQRFLDSFQKENGLVFDIQRLAKYEKFPYQFQADILVQLSASSNSELVFQSLQVANLFNTNSRGTVSVIGPMENGEALDFEVILNQDTPNQPVKWVHIQTA